MTVLNLQSRIKKIKEVISSDMKPDMVLLNLESGYYYSTNETGAAVWDMCNGDNTIGDIVRAISEMYQKNHKEIETDIMELILDLMKENLVEVVE